MSELAVKDTTPELRVVEVDVEMPEEVPVLDDMDAEFLLGQIKMANAEYEKMEAWYTQMLARANEARMKKVQWAENNLRAYFETVPKKETKTQQSYELPSGKLVLKHQEPEYSREDEKLVDWLKKNERADLVKVKESPDWAGLKKELQISPDGASMVTTDGEVVPGITVTPREDKFTVTIK